MCTDNFYDGTFHYRYFFAADFRSSSIKTACTNHLILIYRFCNQIHPD